MADRRLTRRLDRGRTKKALRGSLGWAHMRTCLHAHSQKARTQMCRGICVCVLSVTVACKAPQMESVYQIELSVRWWLMAPMPAPLQMNIASLIESAEEGGEGERGSWLAGTQINTDVKMTFPWLYCDTRQNSAAGGGRDVFTVAAKTF